MHNRNKPHFGIVLISLFYLLIALSVVALFVYTYVTTSVPVASRVFGIPMGFILGFSIFYIGLSIWKGQAWARLVVIVVSGGIVLFNIIAYLIGRIVTIGSAIYLIAVLVINILIIHYLFSKRAKKYFHKEASLKEAISRVIKEHYEEHRANNKE
jgi:cbb3-type cytochrome oxidase subunit 3